MDTDYWTEVIDDACGLYDSRRCLETTPKITVFTFHSRGAQVNGAFRGGGAVGEDYGEK